MLEEAGETDAAGETREDYLIHRRKKGDQRYKVLPRPGDREFLAALLDDKVEGTAATDGRIAGAYRFFRKRVARGVDEHGVGFSKRLRTIATHGLQIVVITIDQEDPYEIFESLNSTGLPLSEADLIRNYVFMKVVPREQEGFDKSAWGPIESFFEEHPHGQARGLQNFYRAYLASAGGYIKRGRTYATFKDRLEARDLDPRALAAELQRFLEYEKLLANPGQADTKLLQRVIEDFVAMEARTAVPLVFALLEQDREGKLSRDEVTGCLRDLVSFLFRRAMCRESTRPYGRWFAVAVAEVTENGPEGLREYLLARGWPDDAALVRELMSFPVYKRELQKARHVLLRLEEKLGHKERVDPKALTIEHVMPQKIGSNAHGESWKEMLGEGWKEIHVELLHTLGNLTLTGYNAELGNRSYAEKRKHLKASNLLLNNHFADLETWDADAIEQRSENLAGEIANLLPRPKGMPYRPGFKPGWRRLSKQKRNELRSAFWSGVLERLRPHSELWTKCKPTRQQPLKLKTGYPTFRWYLSMTPTRGILEVAVLCRGPKAVEHFEALQANDDEIEESLGQTLDWESGNDGNKQRFVTRERVGLDFLDQVTWPELQEWCYDQVVALEEAFEPHFQELQPKPDPEEGIDRAYWQSRADAGSLELWDELLEALSQEGGGEVTSWYGPCHLGVLCNGVKNASVRGWPRRGHLLVEGRLYGDAEVIEGLNERGLNARAVSRSRVRFDLTAGSDEEDKRVAVDALRKALSR